MVSEDPAAGHDLRDRGREAFRQRAWTDAYEMLSAADRSCLLEPADLELLATAAYLLGRDEAGAELLTRAHRELLRRDDPVRAARCAFWLAFHLLNSGELARGGGWVARARRLLDDGQHDCVEQGYLLYPPALRAIFEGDDATACATFGQAADIGDRFREPDLVTMARVGQGRALIRLGEHAEGVALLDEAMVSVTAGELSAIVAGDHVLHRDRGLPGDLRSAPGAGVDRGADPLVCLSAGPGPLSRSVPGASGRDHGVARGMVGCDGRGPAGV